MSAVEPVLPSDDHVDDGSGSANGPRGHRRLLVVLLIVYAAGLALIGFWPTHVDEGASGLLARLMQHLPYATYARVEFGSNIVLFLPLGVLLALLMSRSQRYLVMPIGFLVSVGIESGQALFLPGRTPSVDDILSNTAGACLGLVLVAGIEAVRGRRRRDR